MYLHAVATATVAAAASAMRLWVNDCQEAIAAARCQHAAGRRRSSPSAHACVRASAQSQCRDNTAGGDRRIYRVARTRGRLGEWISKHFERRAARPLLKTVMRLKTSDESRLPRRTAALAVQRNLSTSRGKSASAVLSLSRSTAGNTSTAEDCE